jgi:hypothetical protein
MSFASENGGKSDKGRDRRYFRRKNVVDRQLVTVDLGDGRSGILIDISEDGIAVQPFLPLRVGTRVRFEFDLPRGSGRVSGHGVVMWTGRTGRTGIHFVRLTQRSWNHVESWLKAAEDPLGQAIRKFKMHNEQHVVTAQRVEEQGADDLDLETALNLIAERACSATRAEGAALIMASRGGFICRASVGNAPDAGVKVSLDSTVTGDCLRLGLTINCADATTDKRVNAAALQQLKIRSILVVPVLAGTQVMGAIEVLSSGESAFTERDVSRLEQLANIAAQLEDGAGEPTEVSAPGQGGPERHSD